MPSNTISDLVPVNFQWMETCSLDFKIKNETTLSTFLDYVFHFAVYSNSVHINDYKKNTLSMPSMGKHITGM